MVHANDYVIRVVDSFSEVSAQAWDDLVRRQAHPTPFMRWAYLNALHETGCANADSGWALRVFLLEKDSRLLGALPAYLKSHSYGEYVFDWSWANAYQRLGLSYYPKVICAAPFTPCSGSRLLAASPEIKKILLQALQGYTQAHELSSAHVLFFPEEDRQVFEASGWMLREGIQFHWQEDPLRRAQSFDEFLEHLNRTKRKKIVQERRHLLEAGVTFTVLQGTKIQEADWDYFHACYLRTYAEHGSSPYLNRAFFSAMQHEFADHWVMFVAWREGQRIAVSLVAIDESRGMAWGRYWGSTEPVRFLHFEACYYQPLSWCIAKGFKKFEGGAQGEHKMARGLLPVKTFSAHWIADARFARAVSEFLENETAHVDDYLDDMEQRSPIRKTFS